MATVDDPPVPDAPKTDERPSRSGIRPLLVRLHFYAGILVGPFLLVVAATGFLYALAPQIENILYRDTLFVESSGTTAPLSEQVASARERQPDGTLLAIRPAPGPGDTTRVFFGVPGLGESERLAVFVNPGNAEVTGELVAYGSSSALPFRSWLSKLHSGLHLGDPGRIYSEMAASWLWVIALAGLVLWWTGRRAGSRLRPQRSGGENVSELRAALNWTTPAVSTGLDATGHGGHEGHTTGADPAIDSWDRSLESARSAQLDGPVEIAAPKKAGSAFVVQEIGKFWPTQADSVAVDPATGKIVDIVRFDDYPLAAKLSRWGIDAHMGLLFGFPNQLLLALIAAVIFAMVIWGYRMWWLRRPTRGHAFRLGRPAKRGAWRGVPVAAVLVLTAVAVGIGLFLPVLGVSLAAFVVIDLLVGLYRGRTTGRPAAPTEDQPSDDKSSKVQEDEELLV